jgi:hypothetical protein
MANTQQQMNPFAQALQNHQELDPKKGAVDEMGALPSFDQLRQAFGPDIPADSFRDALAQNGQQDLGAPENLSKQRVEIHARYQELTEQQKQVEIFAGKRLKDEQEVVQIQQQIVLMAAQKKMPEPQQPKIVEARVVDPGERQYLFAELFSRAMKKIREYTEPQKIVAKRNSKRTGLVSNASQDEAEQMKLHHEFNVNGGA